GLMAIFGAPLPLPGHAPAAVRAALDMIEMIELFGVDAGGGCPPPIRMGVGIATGEVIAGYTGTQQRATYTCIGDAVNLAARLEAHTKLAACPILIDNSTRLGLDGSGPVKALGAVEFKGKALAVDVFSVDAAR